MNHLEHRYKGILLAAALLLSLGTELKAVTYSKSYSSGTHTIEILSAEDGNKFLVKQDGTLLTSTYDDLGAITISGGATTFTINTPNLIWFASNGKFSVTGSGKLTIVQDPSIIGNSVFKRPTTNLNELVNVNGANANLTITGNGDESRIVFNGNGKFVMPSGEPTETSLGYSYKFYPRPSLTGDYDGNVKAKRPIILATSGTVTLNYTNLIYNYNIDSLNENEHGGAINIFSSSLVKLTMNHSSIKGCFTGVCGAAIFFENTYSGTTNSFVSMNYCEICDCFTYCGFDLNYYSGGCTFRSWGSSRCPLLLNFCEIHHNIDNRSSIVSYTSTGTNESSEFISCYVHDNQCAFGRSASVSVLSNINIESSSIIKNIGTGLSLGTYNSSVLPAFRPYDLKINMDENTIISDNEATGATGGMKIDIRGETGTGNIWKYKEDGTPISIIININGAQIYNNKSASSAGGIRINKYSNVPVEYETAVNIISGTIRNNTTTSGSGGGFYISGTLPVTIGQDGKNLSIYGNEAQNGGGLYISDGADVTIYDCEIGKETGVNKAKDGNGGAFYVKDSNVKINGGSFHYNQANGSGANGNGGAFYIENGNVTLNGGNIAHNNAQNGGAGLYIKGGDFTVNGGEIQSNTASGNGGGAYVSGGTVTFNGNIHDNNAANGAGLYLAGGADMTYTGGIMTANNARVSGQAISNTAYWNRSNKTLPVEGCGGGIYLENGPSTSKKTSLKFEFPEGQQTFGLYGNTADKAGQEILAEGHFTDITLPAISNMKLAGFEGQDANPNWYQDYFTDDDEYGDNVDEYTGDHHAVTNKVGHIDRYKTIMSRYGGEFVQHLIPDETLGNIKNKYLAITLGFSMLDLTLTANGLLGGETALVKLIRFGSNGQKTYDVMLKKGENETAASKTLINMPWGTYSIIPNNSWNWHYEPIAPMTNIRIGDAATHEIILDYHHNSVAEQPLHYDVHD